MKTVMILLLVLFWVAPSQASNIYDVKLLKGAQGQDVTKQGNTCSDAKDFPVLSLVVSGLVRCKITATCIFVTKCVLDNAPMVASATAEVQPRPNNPMGGCRDSAMITADSFYSLWGSYSWVASAESTGTSVWPWPDGLEVQSGTDEFCLDYGTTNPINGQPAEGGVYTRYYPPGGISKPCNQDLNGTVYAYITAY